MTRRRPYWLLENRRAPSLMTINVERLDGWRFCAMVKAADLAEAAALFRRQFWPADLVERAYQAALLVPRGTKSPPDGEKKAENGQHSPPGG